MSDSPAEGGENWHRLHPLSPVLRFGRVLVALIVVFAPRQLSTAAGPRPFPWFEVGVIVFGLVGGLISWIVTRWRVVGSELQIETGLIRRSSTRIPSARIQGVDIVRPLLGRFFGLAELRVVVAGAGRSRTKLAYLAEDDAAALRVYLLQASRGDIDQSRRPPLGNALAEGERATRGPGAFDAYRVAPVDVEDNVLFEVSNGRLILATLFGFPVLLCLAWLIVVVSVSAAYPGGARPLLGSVVAPLFVAISLIAGRLQAEFEFSVGLSPDGFRLHSGLLQTRNETIPQDRIQAVRWMEPLLWRPFGWCRLEVDIARQGGGGRLRQQQNLTKALLPVGSRAQADALLGYVMPGASTQAPPGSRPPAKAFWRAPLSYLNLLTWSEGRFVNARAGRLTRKLTILPLDKAQSIRLVQGPYLRALGLASLHIDAPGRGWRASALCRPAAEAEELLDGLSIGAGLARRERRIPPGVAPGPIERASRTVDSLLEPVAAIHPSSDAINRLRQQ